MNLNLYISDTLSEDDYVLIDSDVFSDINCKILVSKRELLSFAASLRMESPAYEAYIHEMLKNYQLRRKFVEHFNLTDLAYKLQEEKTMNEEYFDAAQVIGDLPDTEVKQEEQQQQEQVDDVQVQLKQEESIDESQKQFDESMEQEMLGEDDGGEHDVEEINKAIDGENVDAISSEEIAELLSELDNQFYRLTLSIVNIGLQKSIVDYNDFVRNLRDIFNDIYQFDYVELSSLYESNNGKEFIGKIEPAFDLIVESSLDYTDTLSRVVEWLKELEV